MKLEINVNMPENLVSGKHVVEKLLVDPVSILTRPYEL